MCTQTHTHTERGGNCTGDYVAQKTKREGGKVGREDNCDRRKKKKEEKKRKPEQSTGFISCYTDHFHLPSNKNN